MNRNDKRPTWTSLVLDVLVRADDFLSLPDIMRLTGAAYNQATAAVHHLAKCRAIDSVAGGDGRLWWFATTEDDVRSKRVDERRQEEPGTRRRKNSQTKGFHLPPSARK